MAREYTLRALKHKAGQKWEGIHEDIDKLLAETYGVMVYQEDIIKVAHEFVGLTLAGADILRRAMAWKFRVDDGFEQMRAEYFEKCAEKGYTKKVAEEVWRQLEGFAGFSFCKAHSASYAVESYQSLFLKANYPLEFMVGVINNFGGFYNTEFYMNEAKRLGGTIHAPCLNQSEYLTCIYHSDIYLGFVHVKQLEEQVGQAIAEEREKNGSYTGLADFCERVPVGLEQLFILIKVGALRFTGKTKRQLLWEGAMLLSDRKVSMRPATALFPQPVKDFHFPALPQSYREDALQEVELLDFPLCSWFDLLTTDFRGEIKARDMINNAGRRVTMAGCLTNTRLTSTKYGQYMQFGSFRDDEGYTFECVLFPPVYQRCPLLRKGVYALTGIITQEFDVAVMELQKWEMMEVSFDPDENPRANHFPVQVVPGNMLEVGL
jgi:DNA polymerase III alpha subunit